MDASVLESSAGENAPDELVPLPSREPYLVLSREDVLERIRADITAVAETLYITETEAEMLLRNGQWDVPRLFSRWFADPSACRRDAGVYLSVDPLCHVPGVGCVHDLRAAMGIADPAPTAPSSRAPSHQSPCNHSSGAPCVSRFSACYPRVLPQPDPEALAALTAAVPAAPHGDLVPLPAGWPAPAAAPGTQWSLPAVDLRDLESGRPLARLPALHVQCSSAYCDAVPVAAAAALGCGHWFCHDCWRGFLGNEVSAHGRQALGATCMAFCCTRNHAHGAGCKCAALVPLAFLTRFTDGGADYGIDAGADAALVPPSLQSQLSLALAPGGGGGEVAAPLLWWAVDAYVDANTFARWCAHPRCSSEPSQGLPYALLDLTQGALGFTAVACRCGHLQCFRCGEAPHVPAPCDLVSRWQAFSDNSTELWLAAKTKPCPSCKVPIEKNRACNHMTCAMCATQFCWLCSGLWKHHGSSTGGYFACKAYSKQVAAGALSEAERQTRHKNVIMHKYNYYNARFTQHRDGAAFTVELLADLRAALARGSGFMLRRVLDRAASWRSRGAAPGVAPIHVDNICSRTTLLAHRARVPRSAQGAALDGADVDRWNDTAAGAEACRAQFRFLESALEELVECRRLLQYSFVVSFYMRTAGAEDGGRNKKQLFEMQQELLVEPVEHLQNLVEDARADLAKVVSKRKELQSLVRSMQTLKAFIVAQVAQGAFEDALLFEADAEYSQDKWTCSCGQENEMSRIAAKDRCSRCDNCRIHDEPDCRACAS